MQKGVEMKVRRQLLVIGASLAMGALPLASLASSPAGATSPNGTIHYMAPVDKSGRGSKGHAPKSNNLIYHGGISDGASVPIGVETAPKVYLVFWGSQWTNNDKSGEAAILQSFYSNVGGSSWNNTVTQYCQAPGAVIGSATCGSGPFAGNPSSGVLAGSWSDNAGAAPGSPTQSQLAAEAVRAAQKFGNTTAASNASVQYVVATSSGNSSAGFGVRIARGTARLRRPSVTLRTRTCPTSPTRLEIAEPTSLVKGGVDLGPNAGITIVAGHEFAETETDQFPNGGWLDGSGAEIGDKCAWNSATTSVKFGSSNFPVQPLWSNAFNLGVGGCVQSY